MPNLLKQVDTLIDQQQRDLSRFACQGRIHSILAYAKPAQAG